MNKILGSNHPVLRTCFSTRDVPVTIFFDTTRHFRGKVGDENLRKNAFSSQQAEAVLQNCHRVNYFGCWNKFSLALPFQVSPSSAILFFLLVTSLTWQRDSLRFKGLRTREFSAEREIPETNEKRRKCRQKTFLRVKVWKIDPVSTSLPSRSFRCRCQRRCPRRCRRRWHRTDGRRAREILAQWL